MSKEIKLSLIVPTFNRAKFLSRFLESLGAQTLPMDNFEVIVVDNGSTDDTKQVVENYLDKQCNLRYCFEEKPGLHAGRHRGMREASSQILIFADDDIIAAPTWLEAILDSFKDSEVVMVGGKITPDFEVKPPCWLSLLWNLRTVSGKCLSFLSILDFGDGCFEIDPLYVWGCNFAIRKELLCELGGFHPDAMPSDMLARRGDGESYISLRVKERGLKVLYNGKAEVAHCVTEGRMSLAYLKKRSFAQGVSDSYTEIRDNYFGENLGSKLKISNASRPLNLIIEELFRRILERLLVGVFNCHYKRGYAFHQDQFKNNSVIREWVLRKDYLD